jgi:hypothetical protein
VELMESRDIKYLILHFAGGTSYRCTEEETEAFLPVIQDFTRSFARELGLS